MLNYQTQIK